MAKKLYDEYEAEVELEDEVKVEDEEEVAEIHLPKEKKEKGEKKDRKWLNRILSLILGFFIGIFSVWGTIAAVVCFVMFQPIDNTVEVVDTFTGGEFSELMFGKKDESGKIVKAGILDDKYAELKVKDLLGDSMDAIKQLSSANASLAPLNDISPKVGDAIDSLIKGMDKYSIPLDRDKLLNAPFKKNEDNESIGEYFKNALMETPAGDFFKAASSKISPLLEALCYGEKGVDYIVGDDGTVIMLGGAQKMTLGDLMGENMTAALDRVPIETVMKIDLNDSMMLSLAYGNNNRYTISEGVVTMNQVVYTLTETEEGYVFLNDHDQPVVGMVEEISEDFYRITISNGEESVDEAVPVTFQYVAVEGNVGKVYADAEKVKPLLYEKTRIGDLRDDARSVVDNILLADAMDIKADSNKILISIAYGNDFTIEGNEIICDTPRTIGQLRSSKGAFMDDIPLTSVLTEERSNGVTMYMLYGKKGIHYDIDADDKIQMMEQRILIIQDNAQYKVYNEYGEALTPQQGTEGEADFVAGYTLHFSEKRYVDQTGHEYKLMNPHKTQETKDGTATVYYLRELDGSKKLYPVHDLGDLDGSNNLITKINSRLTIGELMDEKTINKSKFLPHVTQYTIEELPKALNDLHLNDVYANEIYVNGKDATDGYKSAWKYLICTYEKDANGDPIVDSSGRHVLIEHDYTLNNLDPLIDNMKENIHDTTLYELDEDGIISFGKTTLDHEIKARVYTAGGGYIDLDLSQFKGKTKLGELTLDEMIDYTDLLVSAM